MTSKKISPTLKVHRTSEQRTSLVEKLVDAGFEVLQNKNGVELGVSEAQSGLQFRLGSKRVGSEAFAEIARQARRAEEVFGRLAALLEAPATPMTTSTEAETD